MSLVYSYEIANSKPKHTYYMDDPTNVIYTKSDYVALHVNHLL